ncbi:hypothetical protein [Streptacidiphilus sp. EB129]|jgi:hypothetical protein|uniref:hypothetical protein n=1 Tax=Streptacidiphilus sp. EB129 TaxID=3156262 RepID=UPI00351741FB
MKTILTWAAATVLALVAAAVSYVCGLWAGHTLDLRPWSEICAGKPLDDVHPFSASWIPLSNMCRWSDGTTKELVPWYVNPLTLALLVTAAVCLVLAVRAAYRIRTDDH